MCTEFDNLVKSSELTEIAFGLYKPPFEYIHGYIKDSDGAVVADSDGRDTLLRIRGWGAIQYLDNAEELQDIVGKIIAEGLTEYWNKKLAVASPAHVDVEVDTSPVLVVDNLFKALIARSLVPTELGPTIKKFLRASYALGKGASISQLVKFLNS